MPHAVSSTGVSGLQALILCGPGSSFPTFTANPDENPKALLLIANRPMLWYPLEFCYRAGITDITLICPPSVANAIKSALSTNPYLTSLPSPSPDLLTPAGLDNNTGTAEIFRLPEVKATIKTNFVVLPCDLVCELGGDKFLQAWMVTSACLEDLLHSKSPSVQHSGGLGVWYETKTANPTKGEETDFVATTPLPSSTYRSVSGSLVPHISNVVYTMPMDSLGDLMEERQGFPIRHGLLRQHPRVRMLMTHRDAHIYIFPHWVLDFISENERLETLGEDVLGWWAKAGWQTGLSEKLGINRILSQDAARSGTQSPSQESHSQTKPAAAKGPYNSEKRDAPASGSRAVPPMLAYIHPTTPGSPMIRRVDTAQILLATSLELAKLPSVEEVGVEAASPYAHARKLTYPEGVQSRTTISKQDSLIAENVSVREKSSIKECVIGPNCQINEGAKLVQCVLMEGVVVGKNCKLIKCVLGKRSAIGEGSVLTGCEVQENLLVDTKSEEKDAKLMSSEGLEATEEEMQEVMDQIDTVGYVNEMTVGE